ncbi:hypothetical protein NDU88_003408 [Pleurodeles waltl]|uniref:Uncharacterized protein n=1 Tax=Pleurodeles waltl TaxID=8319 RepID=A0AAV7Q9Z5_PLEWA|nr:hypothetical protein NDU88_003408 [Pleurodeles waltl]
MRPAGRSSPPGGRRSGSKPPHLTVTGAEGVGSDQRVPGGSAQPPRAPPGIGRQRPPRGPWAALSSPHLLRCGRSSAPEASRPSRSASRFRGATGPGCSCAGLPLENRGEPLCGVAHQGSGYFNNRWAESGAPESGGRSGCHLGHALQLKYK